MPVTYSLGARLVVAFDEAIPLVKAALKSEGFGILTEIDVQKTLREKLGAETEPYVILGACNPALAYRALTEEPEVGLLLPCNVVVRAVGSGSRVDIADPIAMLGIVGSDSLLDVATEARARMERVVRSLTKQADWY